MLCFWAGWKERLPGGETPSVTAAERGPQDTNRQEYCCFQVSWVSTHTLVQIMVPTLGGLWWNEFNASSNSLLNSVSLCGFHCFLCGFYSARQLSEENANLQVNVEKESNEKKRLSRTNEELLWRLQTGDLSPRMSPSSSPIHRPSSLPGSPARPHSYHQWKNLNVMLSF